MICSIFFDISKFLCFLVSTSYQLSIWHAHSFALLYRFEIVRIFLTTAVRKRFTSIKRAIVPKPWLENNAAANLFFLPAECLSDVANGFTCSYRHKVVPVSVTSSEEKRLTLFSYSVVKKAFNKSSASASLHML